MFPADEKVVMSLINFSVILLGTLGMILNGFSLNVLWKCMTTGQLGIKLVLLSDLVVCLVYVVSNIHQNIVNSVTDHRTTIIVLATINRVSIQIALFVSNWWIIALLILRILTLFFPKRINSWNKMLYHKVVYGSCWVAAIVIIIPLRDNERYTRVIIYVPPVVLVSLEAGLIIYGILRVKQSQLSPAVNTPKGSYQEAQCSNSTNSSYLKMKPATIQTQPSKYPKPYNNIVLTILALALNFLIFDCLQFIDALYSICKFRQNSMPTWFMLLINTFSLLKRIFNFVILCAKCRYFRKIMNLKLNLISRHCLRRRHFIKRNLSNYPHDPWKGFSHCGECQKPMLFVKENEFVSESNLIERLLDTAPFPMKGLTNRNFVKKEPYVVDSYYSAFEVIPYLSQVSRPNHHHKVMSARY